MLSIFFDFSRKSRKSTKHLFYRTPLAKYDFCWFQKRIVFWTYLKHWRTYSFQYGCAESCIRPPGIGRYSACRGWTTSQLVSVYSQRRVRGWWRMTGSEYWDLDSGDRDVAYCLFSHSNLLIFSFVPPSTPYFIPSSLAHGTACATSLSRPHAPH